MSVSRLAACRPKVTMTVRVALVGLAGFFVLGNVAIAGVSAWVRHSAPAAKAPGIEGIGNFRVVDDHLWRGAAPSEQGYRSLAAVGVRTVVDLRAEPESQLRINHALLGELGLERVAIPLRDGQTPSDEEMHQFLGLLKRSDTPVFVHCGAGVGRTGTMVAAYLVASDQASGWSAMRRNLAVGPPSLEQLAFAARLEVGDRPGPLLVATSRVLDAPRRIWARLSD